MNILRLRQVEKKIGLKKTAIYSMIARKEFPKQVKLTARDSGWIESEVNQWITEKIALRESR